MAFFHSERIEKTRFRIMFDCQMKMFMGENISAVTVLHDTVVDKKNIQNVSNTLFYIYVCSYSWAGTWVHLYLFQFLQIVSNTQKYTECKRGSAVKPLPYKA